MEKLQRGNSEKTRDIVAKTRCFVERRGISAINQFLLGCFAINRLASMEFIHQLVLMHICVIWAICPTLNKKCQELEKIF